MLRIGFVVHSVLLLSFAANSLNLGASRLRTADTVKYASHDDVFKVLVSGNGDQALEWHRQSTFDLAAVQIVEYILQ